MPLNKLETATFLILQGLVERHGIGHTNPQHAIDLAKETLELLEQENKGDTTNERL